MFHLRTVPRSERRRLNQLNDRERYEKDAFAEAQAQLLASGPTPWAADSSAHAAAMAAVEKANAEAYTQQAEAAVMELRREVGGFHSRPIGNLSPLLPGLFRLNGKPYTLDRHFVFEPLFETQMPTSITVKSGRQIGKCVVRSAEPTVWLADGRLVGTDVVKLGDELLSYDAQFRPVRGRVVNIFKSGVKRCYRVGTRLGAELEITAEHRIRTLSGYKTLAELEIGDRICAARRSGIFGTKKMPQSRIVLTALLIGDGTCGTYKGHQKICTLTNETPSVIAAAQQWPEVAPVLGVRESVSRSKRRRTRSAVTHEVRFSTDPRYQLRRWLVRDNIWGKYSYQKTIPSWVFQLPREQTQQFISWLYATDGSIKPPQTVEYYTTSRTLARQVRSLLSKFGIPASIARKKAGYRKKNGRYKRCRDVWTVRVETRNGLKTFFENFTVPGRPSFALRTAAENNNRDTIPQQEVQAIIDRSAVGLRGKHGTSFATSGLRQKLKYPPQRAKVRAYCDHFCKHGAPKQLVDELEIACSEDVIWDEIVSIEDIGKHETIDFEVDAEHNFVLDGVVVHNSQSQAARLILMCATFANFRVLVIMPLFELVRKFSSNYVRPMIMSSPLASVWQNTRHAGNVLQRDFRHNGSSIFFSFASTSPDRARGIPATAMCVDELQDIDISFLPILRETMSGSPWPNIEIKTGTPKTFDNTMQIDWEETSAAEYMIKCDRGACSYENYPRSDLDLEAMMGPKVLVRPVTASEPGIVCAKCGRPLNAKKNGRWIHTEPEKREREGYHIPQVIVPQHYEDDARWRLLLSKRRGENQTQPYQFFNEALGESYDKGAKLITIEDLRRVAVLHENILSTAAKVDFARYTRRAIAVDWGGGGEDMISYTTVAVVGLRPDGKCETIFGWRCPNIHDYNLEVRTILKLFTTFQCHLLAHDCNGIGGVQEAMLKNAGLPEGLIVPIAYIAHAKGPMMRYVPYSETTHNRAHYQLVKSRSLTYLAALIRKQHILFFRYDYKNQGERGLLRDFTTLHQDFLDSRGGQNVYNVLHNKKLGPDDFAQAVNYGVSALYNDLGTWPSTVDQDVDAGEFSLAHLPRSLDEYAREEFDPRTRIF